MDGRSVIRRATRTDGSWLGLTLFDHVTPEMRRSHRRDLRPGLSRPAGTYQRRWTMVNANRHGNGTVFTGERHARAP